MSIDGLSTPQREPGRAAFRYGTIGFIVPGPENGEVYLQPRNGGSTSAIVVCSFNLWIGSVHLVSASLGVR